MMTKATRQKRTKKKPRRGEGKGKLIAAAPALEDAPVKTSAPAPKPNKAKMVMPAEPPKLSADLDAMFNELGEMRHDLKTDTTDIAKVALSLDAKAGAMADVADDLFHEIEMLRRQVSDLRTRVQGDAALALEIQSGWSPKINVDPIFERAGSATTFLKNLEIEQRRFYAHRKKKPAHLIVDRKADAEHTETVKKAVMPDNPVNLMEGYVGGSNIPVLLTENDTLHTGGPYMGAPNDIVSPIWRGPDAMRNRHRDDIARNYHWLHNTANSDDDIIGYRVIRKGVMPKAPKEPGRVARFFIAIGVLEPRQGAKKIEPAPDELTAKTGAAARKLEDVHAHMTEADIGKGILKQPAPKTAPKEARPDPVDRVLAGNKK